MVKKVFLGILFFVLLLSIPLACVAPTGTETNGGSTVSPIQDMQNRVTFIEGNFTKTEHFTALTQRVNVLEARPTGSSAVDAYLKGETYTRAEVENRIATEVAKTTALELRVKALEDWKAGTGTGTNPVVPITGQVSVTTNPVAVQTMGNTQVCYTMNIVNGTSQWAYARPILNVNLHTGQAVLTTPLTAATILLTAGGSAGNYVDLDFQVTGTNSNAILIPTTLNGGGTGEIQIGAGVTAQLLVCIQVTHPDSRIWDISSTVNWRSL